jgi:hypothetical protein
MRTYRFHAKCSSGEWRTFEFQAANWIMARQELSRLIEVN